VPQDPATIQRQIENTRAELAETLDAIAGIVSPKRVASRAVEQIKDRFEDLRGRGEPADDGHAPPRALPPGSTPSHGTGGRPVLGRSVRWERVGAVAAVLGATFFVLRRHRRRGAGAETDGS
jgi:hypothetical protein